jgi:hypothetical protein
MKLFRNVALLCAVNQFILDFQQIVPLRIYFPDTAEDLSEKSRFLSLTPPSELNACYLKFDIVWFVRRANHIGVEHLVQMHASRATLSGEEK